MPDRTPKPNTKPLKPYRRGLTLGKDSRAGRTPKAALSKGQSVGGRNEEYKPQPKVTKKQQEEDDVPEDEDEEEAGAEGEVEAVMSSEEEREAVLPGKYRPKERKPSGKKGKKFLTNDAMLSLVASIAGATEAKNKSKVAKLKPKKKPIPEAVQKSQREAVKKLEFDTAKAVVVAKAKESKDRKMGRKPKPSGAAGGAGEEGEAKKRVSFA